MASITNDVAELESLVESLQAENRILHNAKVQNEFQIFELQRSNEKLAMERDHALDTSARMKVILDQAGAAIVHGMKAFHEVNRERQTREITKDEGLPLFLQGNEDEQQTVQ